MRSISCGERAILNQDADGDCPYPRPIRVTEHTARKAHDCDACLYGGILAGERYTQLVYLDHDEGGFRIERHCHIAGCKRSDEHLDWLLREQAGSLEEWCEPSPAPPSTAAEQEG